MENRKAAFLVLLALCILAYAPALSLPLLEDDYPLISLANTSGPGGVLVNPVFRVRATSCWAMMLLWRMFHLTPFAYHLASLLLHVVNTWLMYGIGLASPRVHAAAFWGAAFFAVAEGHQEAVMWFSALSELLQFLFGAAALWCWMQAPERRQTRVWLAGSAVLYALALLSKESAVTWLPLLVLMAPSRNWRRTAVQLLPFVALSALAILSIAITARYSFRFSDGSFSWHSPFLTTWIRNIGRVLWIWGWVALVAIAWRYLGLLYALIEPLLWIAIGLIPYCFLTYSHQIPSRQTYLASVGLAWMFGIVFERLAREPARQKLAAVVLAAALVHNIGILWIRKRAQFARRAEPTEQLILLARQTDAPIWVRCFPRTGLIAIEAVHLATGRAPSMLIWSGDEAAARKPVVEFCYK